MTYPKQRLLHALCPALTLLALIASPHFLRGASGTWTAESDGTWEDSLNWASGTIADGTDYAATFSPASATDDITITLGTPHSIKSLTFGANATGNWRLTGSALSLSVSSGGSILSVASGNTVTIDTLLNASRSVFKQGAGTLVLTQNNTGITSIFRLDAGVTELRNAGALGQGTIQGNGGTLTVNTGAAATLSNLVNLTNNLTFNSGYDLTLTGTLSNDGTTRNVTWTGGKTLTLGAISLTGTGGLGLLGDRNSSLHFSGPITSAGGGLLFSNNFFQNIIFSGNNTGFGGNITTQNNVGRVIAKTSANALGVGGTLKLGNNQKFEMIYDTGVTMSKNFNPTGITTVIVSRETDGVGVVHQMGAFALDGGDGVSFTKGDHITSGTTGIRFTGTTLQSDNGTKLSTVETQAGVIVDFGGVGELNTDQSLKLQGAGTVEISGASSYTGTTQVASGTLLLSGSGSTGSGALTVSNTAVLAGAGTVGGNASISGGGTLHATGGTLNVLGNLTLAATTSTVRLSLDNGGAILGTAPAALTLNGALVLTLNGEVPAGNQTLFSGFGSTTGHFTSVTLTGAVSDSFTLTGTVWTADTLGWTLDESTGVFYAVAVPEPGTLGLLSFVGLGILLYRKRRLATGV